jgi:hypothetical protein
MIASTQPTSRSTTAARPIDGPPAQLVPTASGNSHFKEPELDLFLATYPIECEPPLRMSASESRSAVLPAPLSRIVLEYLTTGDLGRLELLHQSSPHAAAAIREFREQLIFLSDDMATLAPYLRYSGNLSEARQKRETLEAEQVEAIEFMKEWEEAHKTSPPGPGEPSFAKLNDHRKAQSAALFTSIGDFHNACEAAPGESALEFIMGESPNDGIGLVQRRMFMEFALMGVVYERAQGVPEAHWALMQFAKGLPERSKSLISTKSEERGTEPLDLSREEFDAVMKCVRDAKLDVREWGPIFQDKRIHEKKLYELRRQVSLKAIEFVARGFLERERASALR